jgi:predicted TIM-barrel fold metal-dependent hydrolase
LPNRNSAWSATPAEIQKIYALAGACDVPVLMHWQFKTYNYGFERFHTMLDENFARDFVTRHQDKLLFGSDCNDRDGGGPSCLLAQIIAAIRRLSANRQIERKLLYENAKKVFRL